MFRFLSKLPVDPCWICRRSLYRNVSHTVNLDTVFSNIIRKSVIQAWRPPFSNYAGPHTHETETVTINETSYHDHIWRRLSGPDTYAPIITPTLRALERYASKITGRNKNKFTVNTAGKIRKLIGDLQRAYFRTGRVARDACKDGEGGESKPHPSKKQRKSPKKELQGPCQYIKEECLKKTSGDDKKKACTKKNPCSKATPCKKSKSKRPSACGKAKSECRNAKKSAKPPCSVKKQDSKCGGQKSAKSPCGDKTKKKDPCGAKKATAASKSGNAKSERPTCPSRDNSSKKSKKSTCGSSDAKKVCGGKKKESTCHQKGGGDKSSKCKKAVSCSSSQQKKKTSKSSSKTKDRCSKQKAACGKSKSAERDRKKVVCSKKKHAACPKRKTKPKDSCKSEEKKTCSPAKGSGSSGSSEECDKGKSKKLKSSEPPQQDPCKKERQANSKCDDIRKEEGSPCKKEDERENTCHEKTKQTCQRAKEEDSCGDAGAKRSCAKLAAKTACRKTKPVKNKDPRPGEGEEDPCAKLQKIPKTTENPCRQAKQTCPEEKRDREQDPCSKAKETDPGAEVAAGDSRRDECEQLRNQNSRQKADSCRETPKDQDPRGSEDLCKSLPCKEKLKCERQRKRWKRLMNEWLKTWSKR